MRDDELRFDVPSTYANARRVAVLLIVCSLAACTAASKEDRLARRLGLEGRIEGRSYEAPGGAFRIRVHPDAQPWLDATRPTRPEDNRIPGHRWLRDGHRVEDGARVEYVTFWSAAEEIERWDGYDAHRIEVWRRSEGADPVDPWTLVEAIAAEYAERYRERFGERMTIDRIAHGEMDSRDRRYVHAAYSYRIKGTLIPNVLAIDYRAYANICIFEPQPRVQVVAVGEAASEGREVVEQARERRIARDGCDLAWLQTLKLPAR